MSYPTQVTENNIEAVRDFILENHFGTITSYLDGKINAIQIPFFIDEDDNGITKLYGHVYTNPESQSIIKDGAEVLCILQGPYTYISPSWFSEPNLPAWNHKTVQIAGKAKALRGKEAWNILSKKLAHFEKSMDKPLKINDIPFILENEEIQGIHIFEIEWKSIETSFHLGQKCDDVNYNRIIRELKKQDSYDAMLIAFEMEQYLKVRRKMQQ